MAAIRITMTSAVGVAAATGGFRQSALDHDLGSAKELAEECFLPNHIIMLGTPRELRQEKEHTSARYLQSKMRKYGLRALHFAPKSSYFGRWARMARSCHSHPCILFASARFGLSVLVGDWIGIRREADHTLRRSELAAWIIDRPPALLSQGRGESQAARAAYKDGERGGTGSGSRSSV